MIRASSRSVPGATALPKWRPHQTGDAFPQKALSPEFDRIDATKLAATDRGQSLPARQTQNDPSSSHIIGSAALAAAYAFQLTAFRRTQLKGAGMKKPYTNTVRCHCYSALVQRNAQCGYRKCAHAMTNKFTARVEAWLNHLIRCTSLFQLLGFWMSSFTAGSRILG
jgi:hypothetical protein